MSLHDTLHQRETQSCSGTDPVLVGSIVPLEDVRQVFFRYADSRVGNGDPDSRSVRMWVYGQGDMAAWRSVLQGIVKEIGHDLAEAPPITFQSDPGSDGRVEADSPVGGNRSERFLIRGVIISRMSE